MAYDFLRTKLSVEVVEEVEKLLSEGKSYSSISQLTGVSKASISRIKNGNYTKFEKEFDITQELEYKELAKQVTDLKAELKVYKRRDTIQGKTIENLREEIESLNHEITQLQLRLSIK